MSDCGVAEVDGFSWTTIVWQVSRAQNIYIVLSGLLDVLMLLSHAYWTSFLLRLDLEKKSCISQSSS